MRGSTDASRETGRERGVKARGTVGPPDSLRSLRCTLYRMLLYRGRALLGRLRMWGSKASSLGRQRKPQASKQTAAGNPEPPPPTKLSPGVVGWGNTGNLGVGSGPCTEARITEWGGKIDHTWERTRTSLVLLRRQS